MRNVALSHWENIERSKALNIFTLRSVKFVAPKSGTNNIISLIPSIEFKQKKKNHSNIEIRLCRLCMKTSRKPR